MRSCKSEQRGVISISVQSPGIDPKEYVLVNNCIHQKSSFSTGGMLNVRVVPFNTECICGETLNTEFTNCGTLSTL